VRRIESIADIEEGVAALARACPHLRDVHALAGLPPLRRRPGGFEGLAHAIVNQQLSVASAGAIWSRLMALIPELQPANILKSPIEGLRACGLSRGKVETLIRLAEAMESGALDLAAFDLAAEDEIHAALTGIKGIGPWTADIYIMFCLGRADAWSPGDLALQSAVKDALQLAERPSPRQMVDIGERWRPWRAVAARLLWSYYALLRQRAVPLPGTNAA
jgi:DNA-3-methyladenine glycosylase II